MALKTEETNVRCLHETRASKSLGSVSAEIDGARADVASDFVSEIIGSGVGTANACRSLSTPQCLTPLMIC